MLQEVKATQIWGAESFKHRGFHRPRRWACLAAMAAVESVAVPVRHLRCGLLECWERLFDTLFTLQTAVIAAAVAAAARAAAAAAAAAAATAAVAATALQSLTPSHVTDHADLPTDHVGHGQDILLRGRWRRQWLDGQLAAAAATAAAQASVAAMAGGTVARRAAHGAAALLERGTPLLRAAMLPHRGGCSARAQSADQADPLPRTWPVGPDRSALPLMAMTIPFTRRSAQPWAPADLLPLDPPRPPALRWAARQRCRCDPGLCRTTSRSAFYCAAIRPAPLRSHPPCLCSGHRPALPTTAVRRVTAHPRLYGCRSST